MTSGPLGEPAYSESLLPRPAESQSVLEQARDGGFGLVVMGTHRHGRIGAALLGSVSAGVAARAGRPVLVVPEPSSAPK